MITAFLLARAPSKARCRAIKDRFKHALPQGATQPGLGALSLAFRLSYQLASEGLRVGVAGVVLVVLVKVLRL